MQKVKLLLILLGVLLVLSLGALGFIVNTFAPDTIVNVLWFYLVIGLLGFSLATLIGFYLRKLFGQRELLNSYLASASRQGLWLSLILIISFILLRLDLFNWINSVLLVLTFIFFEFYLLNRHTNDPEP